MWGTYCLLSCMMSSHLLSSLVYKSQWVTSSKFQRGIYPAADVSVMVSPGFSSKRFSPHPHLKEKHTKLKLPHTQIPFPHLCRSRDHVCQARGQACYSCELLQTELKETLHLSLKGMQNISAFGALLFRIKSGQYCWKRDCKPHSIEVTQDRPSLPHQPTNGPAE